MKDKDTGGPAFPHLRRNINGDTFEPISEGGMTLRDYFAGQALAGLIVNNSNATRQIVTEAWEFADAMLKARSEP